MTDVGTPDPPGPDRARLRGNIPRVLWIHAAWMFLVIIPVIVPFLQDHGLDMREVYLLQSVFALTVVILEVPSGYVADLIGRRRTLLIAGLLNGVGFGVLATASSLSGFVAFEILVAIGASLYSGTDVALLYDTREALGDHGDAGHDLGRKILWGQTGETVASLLGGALVFVHVMLPAWANAVTAWIPFVLALGIVEPPRARLDPARHLDNFRRIHRALFAHSRMLTLVMANLVAYGLATLLAVWAFQGYWRSHDIPLAAFGVLWAAYNLTVALVARGASGVEARLGPVASVLLIAALPVVGYLGMGLGGTVVGIVAGFAFQVGRGLTQVILRHALNTRVPGELRATANSVSSLGVRLAFAMLGPLLGGVIDGRGYGAAFGGMAALFLVVGLALAVPLAVEIRLRATPPPAR